MSSRLSPACSKSGEAGHVAHGAPCGFFARQVAVDQVAVEPDAVLEAKPVNAHGPDLLEGAVLVRLQPEMAFVAGHAFAGNLACGPGVWQGDNLPIAARIGGGWQHAKALLAPLNGGVAGLA